MDVLSKEVMNAISDVIMNRPMPIRQVDQIYMKAGDLALQAMFVAQRFAGKDVIFIGDGDAVGLSVAYLAHLELVETSPRRIQVLDFDERIVNSVRRFSDQYRFTERIGGELYNVVDPVPVPHQHHYDAFYTNPPYGASNEGESVKVFVERGIEATHDGRAEGAIVIADDPTLAWTQEVLQNVQKASLGDDFVVSEMIPSIHYYHLDDNPGLRSCNCLVRRVRKRQHPYRSEPLDSDRFERFYGRDTPLRIRYIRETPTLNPQRAVEGTYVIERLEE